MARFYDQLVAALAENQPFALALISGVKGSSPQRIGAKALFFPDGRMVGTLGGGCLEAEVHARAKTALKSGQPATFEMRLDHDFGWDDGLICGGSVSGLILPQARRSAELWHKLATVTEPFYWGVKKDFSIAPVESGPGEWLYQETVSPPNALWIAGAGHVAQAVAPLALQLDFDVTIFDDRPELANHQCFPPDTRLRVGAWHELLQEPMPQPPAFGLIVTRGHQHDALVLTEWIHRPVVFLGIHLSGMLMVIHVTAAPLFAIALSVLALLWAHRLRFDESDLQIALGSLKRESQGKDPLVRFALKAGFWLMIWDWGKRSRSSRCCCT